MLTIEYQSLGSLKWKKCATLAYNYTRLAVTNLYCWKIGPAKRDLQQTRLDCQRETCIIRCHNLGYIHRLAYLQLKLARNDILIFQGTLFLLYLYMLHLEMVKKKEKTCRVHRNLEVPSNSGSCKLLVYIFHFLLFCSYLQAFRTLDYHFRFFWSTFWVFFNAEKGLTKNVSKCRVRLDDLKNKWTLHAATCTANIGYVWCYIFSYLSFYNPMLSRLSGFVLNFRGWTWWLGSSPTSSARHILKSDKAYECND